MTPFDLAFTNSHVVRITLASVGRKWDVHNLPRDLFDMVKGREVHFPAEDNCPEFWSKRSFIGYDREIEVIFYCDEPPAQGAAGQAD